MKKQVGYVFTVFFFLCMMTARPVMAEEIELLRGEEEETEIYLEGSEEAYAVF